MSWTIFERNMAPIYFPAVFLLVSPHFARPVFLLPFKFKVIELPARIYAPTPVAIIYWFALSEDQPLPLLSLSPVLHRSF